MMDALLFCSKKKIKVEKYKHLGDLIVTITTTKTTTTTSTTIKTTITTTTTARKAIIIFKQNEKRFSRIVDNN